MTIEKDLARYTKILVNESMLPTELTKQIIELAKSEGNDVAIINALIGDNTMQEPYKSLPEFRNYVAAGIVTELLVQHNYPGSTGWGFSHDSNTTRDDCHRKLNTAVSDITKFELYKGWDVTFHLAYETVDERVKLLMEQFKHDELEARAVKEVAVAAVTTKE